ncbi:MAG: HEPN domain-containing protein [Pseudomonadota bacterium]
MKDETRMWLSYADENLEVAVLALEHGHLNSCLQNAQQAVEKYLKACIPFTSLRNIQSIPRCHALYRSPKSVRMH